MKTLHALCLIVISLLAGCEQHSHSHDDEHKVPGKFILHLLSDTDTASATWSDMDGPGGSPPMVDTLILRARNTYMCHLVILATDGDTLSDVIARQGTEHQLFYSVEGVLKGILTIKITDRDQRGMPLGLLTEWEVGSAHAPISGSVRIKLYHYDRGTKDGANPSPETDADVRFPSTVVPK